MGFQIFHKYPLLRIVIPMLGGIFFADQTLTSPTFQLVAIGIFLFLLPMAVLLNVSFNKSHQVYKSYLLGATIGVLFFLLGFLNISIQERPFLEGEGRSETLVGHVASPLSLNSDGSLAQYDFNAVHGGNKVFLKVFQRVSIDTLNLPKEQDEIVIKGQIHVPKSMHSGYVFDYRNYLKHRKYQGVVYTPSDAVYISSTPEVSFRFSSVKSSIQHYIDKLGLSTPSRAVVSALLIGNKDILSIDVKRDFSSAGVSHVLALSGLHVGLLYAVVHFVMITLLFFTSRKRTIASVVSICLLWCFALLTGASPSVVRASLFLSLYVLAELFNRKGQGVNILLFTSFIMLVVNPFWLFDLGFQLSFSAVLGILLFVPLWQNKAFVSCIPLRYIWNMSVLTIAAQLGTLPLVLYYFGSFPTYFIFANLLIIPAITLILYLSLLLLITSWIPLVGTLMVTLVNLCIEVTNIVVHKIGGMPSIFDGKEYISSVEAIVLMLVITALYFMVRKLSFNRVLIFLFSLLFFSGSLLLSKTARTADVGIGSYKGVPFLHTTSQAGVVVMGKDSLRNKEAFKTTFERLWAVNRLEFPDILEESEIIDFYRDSSLVVINDISIGFPSIANLNTHQGGKIDVDYLYLDRNNYQSVFSINQLVSFKTIIYHENLSDVNKNELFDFSNAKNIEIKELHEKAYVWLIP